MSHNKEKLIEYANGPSLEEINNTVDVPKDASFLGLCWLIVAQVPLLQWAIWTQVTGLLQSPGSRI